MNKPLTWIADKFEAMVIAFRRPHPSLRSLKLPSGFRIEEIRNTDSHFGTISKTDGLIVFYDIGTDPAIYLDENANGKVLWERNSVVDGFHVRFALVQFETGRNLLATFEEVNVTFYAWVANEEQEQEMMSIVRTYRPLRL